MALVDAPGLFRREDAMILLKRKFERIPKAAVIKTE